MMSQSKGLYFSCATQRVAHFLVYGESFMKIIKMIFIFPLIIFFIHIEGYMNCGEIFFPVYGSVHSDKYHTDDCVSRKNINDENLVIFKDEFEAFNNGYKPCKSCFYFYYI